MDNFDRDILKALSHPTPGNTAREAQMKEEIRRMYAKKIKTAKIVAWAGVGIAAAIYIPAMIAFPILLFTTNSTKWLIACAVLILGAGQFDILVKLWYWVMYSRFKLGGDLKELQLQVLDLSERLERANTTSDVTERGTEP